MEKRIKDGHFQPKEELYNHMPVQTFLSMLADPETSDDEMISLVKVIRIELKKTVEPSSNHMTISRWVHGVSKGFLLFMSGLVIVLVCGGAHIGISPFYNILAQHAALSSKVYIQKLSLAAASTIGHCLTQCGSLLIWKGVHAHKETYGSDGSRTT